MAVYQLCSILQYSISQHLSFLLFMVLRKPYMKAMAHMREFSVVLLVICIFIIIFFFFLANQLVSYLIPLFLRGCVWGCTVL